LKGAGQTIDVPSFGERFFGSLVADRRPRK